MNEIWTLDDFFRKVDWEGGFDAMADYCGVIEFEDKRMNAIWSTYVQTKDKLESMFNEWNEEFDNNDNIIA